MKWREIIIFNFILLLSSSCVQEDWPDTDLESKEGKVEFSTHVGVKGVDITNPNLNNFGVFAFYTGVEPWSSANGTATPNYMYNRQVTRTVTNHGESVWSYSPVMYWPKGGENLSFFAYAPFATPENKIRISEQTATGMPKITYRVPADITAQQDILYTPPLLDIQKTTYPSRSVPLSFKHGLVKVSFSAKLTSGTILKPGEYVKIDAIRLTDLAAEGTLSQAKSGAVPNWTLTALKDSYGVDCFKGGLSEKKLTFGFQNLSSTDCSLFLMPQTISGESKLTVSYALFDQSGKQLEKFQKSFPFAAFLYQLPIGKAVLFKIELGIESPGHINAEIGSWEDREVEGDFAATYLNISRTNIKERWHSDMKIAIHFETDCARERIRMKCISHSLNPYYIDLKFTPPAGIITLSNLAPGYYVFELIAGAHEANISAGIIRKIYVDII